MTARGAARRLQSIADMPLVRPGSFALVAALAACTSTSPDGDAPCVGKCDSATAHVLAGLEMNNIRSTSESLHFRLIGTIVDGTEDAIAEDQELAVEMWLLDGADPDYQIPATLTFEADTLGGFASEDIDASGFLPWQYMMARVHGRLRSGVAVDQYFAFKQGNAEAERATADWVPSAIADFGASEVSFDPDAPSHVLLFWAELDPGLAPPVSDGDELRLELRSGDTEHPIAATMSYDGDTAAAFVSTPVDVSEFLPWSVISARVIGMLGSDTPVDRTFTVRIDELD
jgi:hypothetical protein